jgi:hypothetical protein
MGDISEKRLAEMLEQQTGTLNGAIASLRDDMNLKIDQLQGEVAKLEREMRENQIDQERERYSMLLSTALAGTSMLTKHLPNQVSSGHHFMPRKKDLKPGSIY